MNYLINKLIASFMLFFNLVAVLFAMLIVIAIFPNIWGLLAAMAGGTGGLKYLNDPALEIWNNA